METLEAILSRRSVREFKADKLSEREIKNILQAGMSGPSCVNSRDWSFIVVDDKEQLNKMADANGRPAEPLRKAALGIMVCGDMQRAFEKAPEYWVIDCSIACQNMILAAEDMGIGSVWLGTYPQMDRVKAQSELFGLPKTIVPHSIIAFGYPLTNEAKVKEYELDRVHYNEW